VTIRPFGRSPVMEKQTKARALSILAAGGIAGAALATGAVGGDGVGGPDEASAESLQPFSSCDQLLEYADDHRWANNTYPVAMEDEVMFSAAEAGGGALRNSASVLAAPTLAEDGAVGPSETGTNVQEEGIDEPDTAKLAGTTLFVVRGGKLFSYDVSGDDAVLLDELEVPFSSKSGPVHSYEGGMQGSQLLIAGEHALVIGSGWGRDGAHTEVAEIDVSDPGSLSAIRTLEVEGSEVSARLRGSTARLVIESRPEFPRPGEDPKPEDNPPTGATGETGPEPTVDDEPDWLPQASLLDLETGERAEGALTGCEGVSFPDEFSGLGLLSVLTIDLESGLEPTDVDSVVTDGSAVYASPESIYVATQTLNPPNDGIVDSVGGFIGPDSMTVPVEPAGDTQIHRFATSDAGETDYASSGQVRGRLIGQFAMSEEAGVLRVASTTGDTWTEGPSESESMITTLGESDGKLEEIGQVGGLGRGEEIYAVRFIGDKGYVVTFEQTDPLYTVDLSDPENPVTTGELKIPGYSAYLHPVADGRLLGIGQSGTDSGTLTGAEASLFDVADPEKPERLDTLDLSGGQYGSTSTEWDHHAFLFSPQHSMAVVPVQSYGRGGVRGAVAVSVDPDGGLTQIARLEDDGQIERMLIAGDNLVTVSTKGVEVRALSEL
jgi:uncharacterized secreted protein with C-terminal beta-propeller domain